MLKDMLHIEVDREKDGRFIAEVIEFPGVLAYGTTADHAVTKAMGLALQVLADRVQHHEAALSSDDDAKALFSSIFKVKSLL
jgi:predicted RNase H-like HicB family nuclease